VIINSKEAKVTEAELQVLELKRRVNITKDETTTSVVKVLDATCVITLTSPNTTGITLLFF